MDTFDTFFKFLKQGIVGLMLIVFAFMAVYVPTPVNNIESAHAGDATLAQQIIQVVFDGLSLSKETQTQINTSLSAGYEALSSAYNYITSEKMTSLWYKEFTLDGLAWAIAKQIISSMTQSLVKWINSGFKGSPAFVQDLQGTLLEAADKAAGNYISNLSGASFLCAPFKLDIQIALDIKYRQSRVNQPTADCNLSDITGNLEDFISGAAGTFENGGWDNWFTITASPERYTPYGQLLAAEAGMRVSVLNAEQEKSAVINFGQGFLSNEVCEMEYGWGEPQEKCYISTPGQTISNALSFNLDSGRQTLVAADEIDEIIGSLLSQIANQAVTGAKGLLGLSEGTGHTYAGYTGGSYVNNLNTQSTNNINYSSIASSINSAITTQQNLNSTANSYYNQLVNSNKQGAQAAANEALTVVNNTNSYITTLNSYAAIINNSASSQEAKNQAASSFGNMQLYTQADANALASNWSNVLNGTLLDYSVPIAKINTTLSEQKALKVTVDNYVNALNKLSSNEGKAATAEARVVSTNLKNIINTLNSELKTLNSFTTNDSKNAAVAQYESLGVYTQQDINNLTAKWQPLLP